MSPPLLPYDFHSQDDCSMTVSSPEFSMFLTAVFKHIYSLGIHIFQGVKTGKILRKPLSRFSAHVCSLRELVWSILPYSLTITSLPFYERKSIISLCCLIVLQCLREWTALGTTLRTFPQCKVHLRIKQCGIWKKEADPYFIQVTQLCQGSKCWF